MSQLSNPPGFPLTFAVLGGLSQKFVISHNKWFKVSYKRAKADDLKDRILQNSSIGAVVSLALDHSIALD